MHARARKPLGVNSVSGLAPSWNWNSDLGYVRFTVFSIVRCDSGTCTICHPYEFLIVVIVVVMIMIIIIKLSCRVLFLLVVMLCYQLMRVLSSVHGTALFGTST